MTENDETIVDQTRPFAFAIAAGSIVGGDHIAVGKNNQDGFHIIQEDDLLIGIICDGCGSNSSPHSEVGSKIGARIIAKELWQMMNDNDLAEAMMEGVRKRSLHKLEIIANYMGETKTETGRLSRSETIKNYFLFTALGFAMTPKRTIVFGIGDGYKAVNGEVAYLKPNEGNEPTYLSYGIVNTNHEDTKFQIYLDAPTEQIESILVGTDGLGYIVKNAENNLPGKKQPIGDLSQFWTTDFFFENPDGVRRRLYLMNKTCTTRQPDGTQQIHHGVLKDDTTMIVVRRK